MTTNQSSHESSHAPAGETPLESWKEIAAHLQRDERTARRWEKTEGLPVHRHHHLSRSSVYAYPSELDAWRAARQPAEEVVLRPLWRRPLPSTAFALALLLMLVMVGSGPRAMLVQAADGAGIITRQILTGPEADLWGAVSPDGKFMTCSDWKDSSGDLAVYDFATGTRRRLTSEGAKSRETGSVVKSVVSPDARGIAYAWHNEKEFYDLRVVGLDGSSPRILYRAEDTSSVEPFDWSKDGKYILATYHRNSDHVQQIVIISVADGSLRVLKTLDRRRPNNMSFSPDGRYVAYDFPPKEGSTSGDIYLLNTEDSGTIPLVEHAASEYVLGWVPDGTSILFASDRLGSWGMWLAPVEGGKPQGPARLVKRDTGQIRPLGFTRDGSFYYGAGGWASDIYSARVDLSEGKLIDEATPVVQRYMGLNYRPAWSPDEEQLAYISFRKGQTEPPVLCIRNEKTLVERETEFKPALWPATIQWFPDSRSLLVFSGYAQGALGFFRVDAASGEATLILESKGGAKILWPVISADGRTLYYVRVNQSENFAQLTMRDLATAEEKEVHRVTGKDAVFSAIALSPDQRQLAACVWRGEQEPQSLIVIAPGSGQARELLETESSRWIQRVLWAPNGKHLLFMKYNGAPHPRDSMELWRIPVEGGEPQSVGLVGRRIHHLTIHPSGRRIAFNLQEYKPEIWVMENFLPAETKADR